MPIFNQAMELSNTTPTMIVPNSHMEQEVFLHNHEKGNNKYIHFGNSQMTLADSMHIDPGETIRLNLPPGDELYAMSDGNGLTVGVLRITQG